MWDGREGDTDDLEIGVPFSPSIYLAFWHGHGFSIDWEQEDHTGLVCVSGGESWVGDGLVAASGVKLDRSQIYQSEIETKMCGDKSVSWHIPGRDLVACNEIFLGEKRIIFKQSSLKGGCDLINHLPDIP